MHGALWPWLHITELQGEHRCENWNKTTTTSMPALPLHGPSMFAIKVKIYGVLYKQSSSIAFDETSSYWSAPKTPNFSAFRWSPRGSLVSIGQHFIATRVVHLPKSTETSLITESDRSGPNHQLLQLCMACTAWSDWTRLCGPCIAVIAGSDHSIHLIMADHYERYKCV